MLSAGIKKFREQASGAFKTLAEPSSDGPTEASVYKNLLVEMQYQQLLISREYQELFRNKEEEIRRLKKVVGEPLEDEASQTVSPRKEQQGAKPLIELSPDDIKVVLKEWEKKMKNNIVQKTEALAEAQIYRESVELLRTQMDSMKETIQEQQAKIDMLKRSGNHDLAREQHQAAMDKMVQEFSLMQAEALTTKEKLAQAELTITALRTKAESDARTLEILSKNAPGDNAEIQSILQDKEAEHARIVNELRAEAESKQAELEKKLADTLEELRKANEQLEALRLDLENALSMQTDMVSRTRQQAEEDMKAVTLERDETLSLLQAKESDLKSALASLNAKEEEFQRIKKEYDEMIGMRNLSSQQELEVKEKALDEARKELYAAQKSLAEFKQVTETNMSDLQSKLDEKDREIESLNGRIENLEQEKAFLATKAAQTGEELVRITAESEAQKREHTSLVEKLQGESEVKQKQLSDQVASAEGRVRDLTSKHDEISANLAAITAQLLAANDSLSELRKQHQHLTEEKLGLEQALVTARAETTKLQEEILDMKKQLDETAERIRKESERVRAECLQEQERRLKEQQEIHQAELSKVKKEATEYKDMYTKETLLRRQAHDELMDIKGNIRVFARVRPVLPDEKKMAEDRQGEGGSEIVTEFPSESGGRDLIVKRENVREGSEKRFEFDHVFDPSSTQEQVFATVAPLIVSVMDGVNVTLFAYGQTGSGKTYTMQGTKENPGVNIRALQRVFEIANERSKSYTYTFSVSVLEVYMDTILDLLGDVESKDAREKLQIRQRPETKSVFVEGLVKRQVTTMQDCEQILDLAAKNRTVGAHNMNEHSSRSHLVFTLTATASSLVKKEKFEGNLNLIDLAGSERISKTEATGERLKEAQAINSSLLALGDVINALALKNSHIPFRNSKITFLLSDQLSGNAKVGFFANVSPTAFNSGETICTLDFASRCRKTELGKAKKNVTGSGGGADVEQLQKENARLRKELEEARGLSTSKLDASFSSTGGGGGMSTPNRTPSRGATSTSTSASSAKRGLNQD